MSALSPPFFRPHLHKNVACIGEAKGENREFDKQLAGSKASFASP